MDLLDTCPDAEHIIAGDELSWPWRREQVPLVTALRWADRETLRQCLHRPRQIERCQAIERRSANIGLPQYLRERPLLALERASGRTMLLDGHHRLVVAAIRKMERVPVVIVTEPR